MNRIVAPLILFCAISSIAPRSASSVTMAWSPVGNAGNAGDPTTGLGSVGYAYNIGTYDVTNRQYAEFLNTKDPTGANTLRLWNNEPYGEQFGGITLNVSNPSGSKYVLVAGRENHPVNFVSWYDAIRFANWLNNGQGNSDTETGAYTLGTLGASGIPITPPLTHNAGSRVWLPTENEWYKAAYYNPDTSSYFKYPTSSDTAPFASAPPGFTNYANILGGGPRDLTDVGAYVWTSSPYGAFDMGGNVWQWNEGVIDGLYRVLRGGSFQSTAGTLKSSNRTYQFPYVDGSFGNGFRLASIPEPSTLLLAALGLVGCLACAPRNRRRPRVHTSFEETD